VVGIVAPVVAWSIAVALCRPWAFLLRFFAGFCLIANGAYIAGGSVDGIGDAGVMLRHGSPAWVLWAFGGVTVLAGLAIWHGQGRHFGFGPRVNPIDPRTYWVSTAAGLLLITIGLLVGDC
jgi:hypothetical protein